MTREANPTVAGCGLEKWRRFGAESHEHFDSESICFFLHSLAALPIVRTTYYGVVASGANTRASFNPSG